jgi:hypothetical protein
MTMFQRARCSIAAVGLLFAAPSVWHGHACLSHGVLHADELPSGWECLPPECGLAARIVNGKAAVEALREGTRFGQLLLDEARLERIREYMAEHQPEEAEEARPSLREFGLAPTDLLTCLSGESGLAVVVEEADSNELVVAGLGWMEPDNELAARLFDAAARWVDESQDQAHPIRRVDIDLEGRTVMELTIPSIRHEYDDDSFNLPDDLDQLSEAEQEEAWRKAIEARERSRREVVRYGFALLTRVEGRIICIGGLQPQDEPSPDRPYVQRLTGILARFLRAHSEESGQFSGRVASVEGAGRVLGQPGLPLCELAIDPARFLTLARAKADPEFARLFDSLGADRLGMLLFRMTLDGTNLRSGLFLAAPAPRQGIFALLDQPAIASVPPAWVPADVVQYGHVSVDLGSAYRQMKQWAIGQFADEAQETFTNLENQFSAMLQEQPDKLLSSLGHQHTVLGFETSLPVVGASGEASDDEAPEADDHIAIVWQVKESETWARIVQAIGVFAGMTQGAARATEEQGFRGWRLNTESHAAGLVLGKGSLVLGLGEGTLERTLSCLNHPPQGPDALHTSVLFSRAQALLPLDMGIGFELTDGNRYVKGMRRWIEASLKRFDELRARAAGDDRSDDNENARNAPPIKDFLELLPSEEELDGVLGVSVGQTQVNDQGLISQSVSELSSPE